MRTGDRSAWTQLHDRYFLTLYAGAYGVTYDAVATEALVESVLHEAWQEARDYRPELFGSVHRWLSHMLFDRTALFTPP